MEDQYSKYTIYGNFVQGRKKFPIDTETIGAMQNNTMLTAVLGHIVGADRVILCGCKGNPRSEGYVWVKNDETPMSGEILYYPGGGESRHTKCFIYEDRADLEVEDETYRDAYSTRYLQDFEPGVFSNDNFSWLMTWSSFVSIEDVMTLKKLKELAGSGQSDNNAAIARLRTALETQIAQERQQRQQAIEDINIRIGNNTDDDEQNIGVINGSIDEVNASLATLNGKINQIRQNLTYTPLYKYVPGMIMVWYGKASDVPQGWVICDGRNNTPDLRGRFVLGADVNYNDSNAIVYERQGTSGGAESVTLTTAQLPAHTHAVECGEAGKHYHEVQKKGFHCVEHNSGSWRKAVSWTDLAEDSLTTFAFTTDAPAHKHDITIKNAGQGQAFSILPPYCRLHYIMYKG
jgi:microcystin-dependent protein